jgi:adenylate kinase family enzyme
MSNDEINLQDLFSLVQNQEERVNYNFNTVLQMTILVEYLFSKLKDRFPDLKLEEDFQAFQDKRIEEFNKMTEEAIESAQKIAATAQEEIANKINI